MAGWAAAGVAAVPGAERNQRGLCRRGTRLCKASDPGAHAKGLWAVGVAWGKRVEPLPQSTAAQLCNAAYFL